ncbi:MAG: formylglycine-generating enzyme family protein [Chloroflexi bacterium]|nr:formylglycine-generating enzyme family protein [Chloroflexota bacterium]
MLAALPAAGQERHDPVSGIDFVWVPEGCFRMGSPDSEAGRYSDEGPVHEVCVDGFWMGKYEVTQAQWEKVMGSNSSRFKGNSRPVERMSWNDVQKFLKTLNGKAGKEIYRLPTEAEWEYAVRAGTTTPFYFGATISTDVANYDGNYTYGSGVKGVYREQTTEVGSFPPNDWGLYDMHGNVWEWCQDWYDSEYYSKSPKKNPQGPSSGEYRVLRGGSWVGNPAYCRSAIRNRIIPDLTNYNLGFRVVVGVVAWTLQ